MKPIKIVLLSILLLFLATAGSASVKDDFSTANSQYGAGRYEDALKIYLQINGQLTHWQVLYNIGNCYFKLDQPLAAKIHYLRARKFRPLDHSIARNIFIVNKSFKDVIVPETPDFISRTLQVLEAKLSLNTLSTLLLAAILLLNIFLFLWLKKGHNKKIIYGFVFSLFLSLALGAYLYNRVADQRQTSTAVVSVETELFKINPGLEVRILDRNRDWVQVAASPQVAGWIELKHLTLI
jgi:tetratricopeptide (TPR) repeat protein